MESNLKSGIKNTHNWQWTTLGDVAKFINGDRGKNYPSSLDRVEKGIPFINTGHIEPTGRLSDIRMEYISREKYDKLGSGKVQHGDIVYCLRGSTIGKTAINSYSEGAIASSLIIIRAKDNICQGYLYYFLTSPVGQGLATINDNGSAQPNLSGRVLASYPLQVPNYQTQVSITKVLSDLDKKIHLNNETNETLEQMAQALFKSWFVDFDPVFDNLLASAGFNLDNLESSLADELKQKAQRRLAALDGLENAAECKASLIALAHELQAQSPTQAAVSAAETLVKPNFNANPNILAQHANTHAHFPNEFEHNKQLGWIPKGWGDVKVNEMVRTVSETYPLKSVDKVIFLNTGDILEGKFLHSEFSNTEGLPGQAKKSIKKGDILYSEIRPKNKRFALVNFDGSEHVVSTKLMVLRPNEGFEELFPYFVLTQEHNISLLQQAAESRSGTFPQITFTELAMIKIALPKDKKLINIFISSFLKDHFAQKDKRDFQNKTLTKLRDTLLPKLISGELQIPDAATVEEIVD